MSENEFTFLCGNFDRKNFVYAIKSKESEWYYFEEKYSIIDAHKPLMTNLEDKISVLNKIQSIVIALSSDQVINYFNDGKFIFKGKELRTCKSYPKFNNFSNS